MFFCSKRKLRDTLDVFEDLVLTSELILKLLNDFDLYKKKDQKVIRNLLRKHIEEELHPPPLKRQ